MDDACAEEVDKLCGDVMVRTFSFLMALFNFAETGKPENLPLVTIPAQ